MKLFLFFLSLTMISCATSETARSPSSAPVRDPGAPMRFASQKLRDAGFSKDFILMVEAEYREDERDKVIELNLLGFLRSSVQNGNLDPRIPVGEIKRVKTFLREHRSEFSTVEKKYQVPKEVIASLLWVETKYGRDIGTFHITSAFYSLLQADEPSVLDSTMSLARTKVADFNPELEQKIRDRSKKKSDWAMEEMRALAEMDAKKLKDVRHLKGSFAGAFGMAQFLPSSYLSWAASKRAKANLFRTDDSIQSVANYLMSNGWRPKDRESQESALFHYNRDRAYVDRILRMSDCLKPGRRVPSAKKSFC